MKKSFIYILLIFGLFFCICNRVDAKIIEINQKFDPDVTYLQQGNYANCEGILTSDGVDMIREILGYFRILGPIALIAFVALDFAQAVISQDNDALKKAENKVVSRVIATALLFFIPTFIRAILGLPGVRDAIEIPDDPLCHTMNVSVNELYYDVK